MSDALKYVLSSEQLLNKYEHLIGDKSGCLWGEHIRVGAVTTIVGETSAGKTTLLHNLAYHLSQGLPFLDVTPPKPLRILYIDYESYNAILAEHLAEIGITSNWHFFDLETSPIVPRGSHLLGLLNEILTTTPYDLLIVDPLLEADPVTDENHSMEANMQILRWRDVARKHRIGVLLVHNTGKGGDFLNAKEKADTAMFRAGRKHAGRGASARTDRADIGMNYVVVDDTTRILKVAKTRGGNMGHSWTLEFAKSQLGFIIKDSHFSISQDLGGEKFEKLRNDLAKIMSEHPGESKLSIFEQYVKPLGVSRATFYRATAQVERNPVTGPVTVSMPVGDPITPLPASPVHTGPLPGYCHNPLACTPPPGVDLVETISIWRSTRQSGVQQRVPMTA